MPAGPGGALAGKTFVLTGTLPRRSREEAAAAIESWFAPMEATYRSLGAIGPRVEVPADAGPAARLLGLMGRRP